MGPIDFAIFVILVIFAYSGFRAGVTQKFFSIAGMLLALVLSVKYMDAGAKVLAYLTGFKGGGIKGQVAHVISFLVIFQIVVAATKFAHFMIVSQTKYLSRWQRGLGAAAGFVEGAVFLSVLLIGLNAASFPADYQKQRSVLYTPALHFAPQLFNGIALGHPGSRGFYQELSKRLNFDGLIKH